MAYVADYLFCITSNPVRSEWLLKTTDAVATSAAAGYITDATSKLSGKGAAGRGMKLGDKVEIQVWDSLTAPTAISDAGFYFVSALNATTGAATLTAYGAA